MSETRPVWTVDPNAAATEQAAGIAQLGNMTTLFFQAMTREGMDTETARYLTGVWLQSMIAGATLNARGGAR